MLIWIGAFSLAAWIYLLLFHSRFWRADQRFPQARDLTEWPSITTLVPARNEATSIAACIRSLKAQDYPGPLRILAIDDSSNDGTADLAAKAGAEVIQAPPLEDGWTGKLWALSHGIDASEQPEPPEWFWFTDADIVHEPGVLRQLVSHAHTDNRALVSLMVKLHCRRFWETLLVPAFVFFFQMLYPFPAVNNPKSKTAGAAGGCVLIRRDALADIGGIAAIREALIDDCALAKALKARGHSIWLGLAEKSRSIRPADGLSSLWHMVTRTAFTQLGYSPLLLLGTIVGMSLVFLTPPALLLSLPWHNELGTGCIGGTAWLAMAIAYRPTVGLYDRPVGAGFLLPITAFFYALMTLHSALNHWFGASSHWKGRPYQR
ncbi:MAG: glycosyltransferase [Alphaproteobacteria bacterium]